MNSCTIFTRVLLVLTLIFCIYSYIFYRKNIYPELDIINQTGNKEDFTEDWWLPTKEIDSNFSNYLKKNNCGWPGPDYLKANCPYDNDTSNDNFLIRQKCSDSSFNDSDCMIVKNDCKINGKYYNFPTDCKGSPNNNCCQRFDRRSGFIGGDGSWCMRCKDPNPEDVEMCKNISTLHCVD